MTSADLGSLLQLFEQVLSPEQWRALEGRDTQAQIYTLPVVTELMLLQRLNQRGTQQAAVQQLSMGQLDHLLPNSKRVREANISHDTGGYARACGRVSVELMETVCDEILGALGKHIEPEPELQTPVLLIDGTGLSLQHEPDLLQSFPAMRNQYGTGHWGMLRVVALHDVQTGITLRPCWGPMSGAQTVSEQRLAEQAIKRAPAGSVILGDSNFGIFSLVHTIAENQQQALFRLTKARADSLGAARLLPHGETRLDWKPTRADRRANPELPPDAQVQGRLIVVSRNGFRDALYLFTTLNDPLEKIVALYLKRWNLELDLRTLKCTMQLHHLRGKSRAAVEKELLMGVIAYGLVRVFMAKAAQHAGIHPRRLSFTCCCGLLNAWMPKLCSAGPEHRLQILERILQYMAKSKLPNRPHQRSYPREVWGFRQAFRRRSHPLPKPKSK